MKTKKSTQRSNDYQHVVASPADRDDTYLPETVKGR